MSKIARALAFSLMILGMAGAAMAGQLTGNSLTPANATENSIYEWQVTWQDDDNRLPLGEYMPWSTLHDVWKSTLTHVPLDETEVISHAVRLYGLTTARDPFQIPATWTDGGPMARVIAVRVKEFKKPQDADCPDDHLYLDVDELVEPTPPNGTGSFNDPALPAHPLNNLRDDPADPDDGVRLIKYIVGAWTPARFNDDAPRWSGCPDPDGNQETNHVVGQLQADFLATADTDCGLPDRIMLRDQAGDSKISAGDVLYIVCYVAWVDDPNPDEGRILDRVHVPTDARGNMNWPAEVAGCWDEDLSGPTQAPDPGYIDGVPDPNDPNSRIGGQVIWYDPNAVPPPDPNSPKADHLMGDTFLDDPDYKIVDQNHSVLLRYKPRSNRVLRLDTLLPIAQIDSVTTQCSNENRWDCDAATLEEREDPTAPFGRYYILTLPPDEDKVISNFAEDIFANVYLKGYVHIVPVVARYDPQNTFAGLWRLSKVCYAEHYPIIYGGLIGVFTVSPLDDAFDYQDPDQRVDVDYNRHIGRILLKSTARVSEPWEIGPTVYYAVYLTGPISVFGLDMAELNDPPERPRDGRKYYVRASCGLNLANDPTSLPGVNYAPGLTASYPDPHQHSYSTRGGCPVQPVTLGPINGPVVVPSNGLVDGGTVTRLRPDVITDPAAPKNRITLPYFVEQSPDPMIVGVFAEVPVEPFVDRGYVGAPQYVSPGVYQPGVDWWTNYYDGATVISGTWPVGDPMGRPVDAILAGSSLVRVQKVELTPDEWQPGLTRIPLWSGGNPYGLLMDPKYSTLRGALLQCAARFTGVFLSERRVPGETNYFSGLEVDGVEDPLNSYDANDPNKEYFLNLTQALPPGTREVYVQYIPYVRVQCIPAEWPRLVEVDGGDYQFEAIPAMPAHGTGLGYDYLVAYSGPGEPTVLDPLIPEAPTTTAGNPPVPNPAGGTQILRRNVLQENAPVVDPYDPDNPDDGTSSTAFVFRVRYYHEAGWFPNAWLPSTAPPPTAWPNRPTGVVLFLDALGIGDYKPYFMAQREWDDCDTTPDGGGTDWYFRVEPASGLDSWITGKGIIYAAMRDNLYVSLLAGRYHYYFACSDDYLPSGDGARALGTEVTLWSTFKDNWREQHYPPYNPCLNQDWYGIDQTNPFVLVDRTALSPGGDRTDYQYNSEQFPNVMPVLLPPELTSEGEIPPDALFEGGGYFMGTLTPYFRAVNPLYDYPSHGATWGGSHNHSGYYTGTDPQFYIGFHGIETSGSTAATEHRFRIKYQSKDPVTGKGIAPAGGVWVFINNAPSAGNAGSTRDIGQGANPSSPYFYTGYRMQPAPGQTLDYAKGVIYEVTRVTLPPGPHTYYFAASDGNRWVRWPARPDGRWANGRCDVPCPPPDEVCAKSSRFLEDSWVPGDQDYADNNDYCPGPYVNHPCVLSDASVTPASGPQGTDFLFKVTYKDADGQRPYRANLIIELDRNTGLTRKVTMTRRYPSVGRNYDERIAEFQNGVEYVFSTAAAADLVLTPGEHRYYFEFVDDWGRQTDPNDKIPGELTRYPEGEGNWIVGPVVMENARPTLSGGEVVSEDATSNSATLWKFAVTYADANNDPPTYVNLYLGEDIESRLVTLEQHTPVQATPGSGPYRVIPMSSTQIIKVVGVWDNRQMLGTNYYESPGSTFDPDTGTITVGMDLPVYQPGEAPDGSVGKPKDVYVTYYHREIKWDLGTAMTKADPNDLVYSDGCRYEAKMRIGGAQREILTPADIKKIETLEGNAARLTVDATRVTVVLGVFDNAALEGFDYYNGYADAEEVLTIDNYSAVTRTGTIQVKHFPVDRSRIVGVWRNKQRTGTNYLDLASTTTADADAGVIRLKSLDSGFGPLYVTYGTRLRGTYSGPLAGNPTEGVIELQAKGLVPLATPYVTFVPPAKKYHYAFEASDGKLFAIYNTRVDPVTLKDSMSAGAIAGSPLVEGAGGREYLIPVSDAPTRQFQPQFRGPEEIDPANMPTPETIGSPTLNESATSSGRGNVYLCTSNRTLLKIEQYLAIAPATAHLWFAVYESDSVDGTFRLIHKNVVMAQTGSQRFFSSGPIAVRLQKDKYYIIACFAEGFDQFGSPAPVTYYYTSSGHPAAVSFGNSTHGYNTGVLPLAETTVNPKSSNVYHQRLTCNATETIFVGPIEAPGYVVPKDVLSAPQVYKTDGKNANPVKVDVPLEREYEDTFTITTNDPSGRTIQLGLVTYEEEAWVIDPRHVQLRHGPLPENSDVSYLPGNASGSITIWDYNDRNLDPDRRHMLTDATASVNTLTGVVELSTDADMVPPGISVVWARYYVYGATRLDVPIPTDGGVSEITHIWDTSDFRTANFSGFDYWTCHADREYVTVQRMAGNVVRVTVGHAPIQRVLGVWNNPNKVGTNYCPYVSLPSETTYPDGTQRFDASRGIIYLKNIPSSVANVYVDYYAYGDGPFVGQPSVYEPSIGRITLGSALPAGKRTVWIQFRQKGDYRLNYVGTLNSDESVASLPSVIFQYDMPVGDPSLDPSVDPYSYRGYIQADYWFARNLPSRVGYNTPPTLLNGKVLPLEGRTTTDFTFTVDYRDTDGPNGQPPAWVRVIIDNGPAIDMVPVVSGTPAYREGARYQYKGRLRSGSHNYHFEASDGAGFAFFGYTGSTPTKIIDLPGPWVNDPPKLSDPLANPNPAGGKISTMDTVDYTVTYADIDNDPPDTNIQETGAAFDLGYPKLWIDNQNRVAWYGVVDKVIDEEGNERQSADDGLPARARKIKFTLQRGPGQTAPPSFNTDIFAGMYLQITSGNSKGRVFLILNNSRDVKEIVGGVPVYNDYLTLVSSNILTEGVTPGTSFVIGPLTMAKNPAESDFTQGITYKVTIPRMAAGDHNFHFSAQSTAYIPLNIGQAFSPPQVTEEQRRRTQQAVPTPIASGPSVQVVAPADNVAPELSAPDWSQVAGTKDQWNFYVSYKDQNGNVPWFDDVTKAMGYVRVIITSLDGTKLLAQDMLPSDGSWNHDFTSPVAFKIENMKVLTGRRAFYFEASDGWQVTTLKRSDFLLDVNSPPALRYPSVNPPTGNESTEYFEYRVNYYDPDGKPIVGGQTVLPIVYLYIDDPGLTTPIPMNVEGSPPDSAYGDPDRGVYFVKRITNPRTTPPSGVFAPGTHTYAFRASDHEDWSDTLTAVGPIVTENLNRPVLRAFQILGVDTPCDPRSGNLTRDYTYKVYYRDPDGDAPLIKDATNAVSSAILLFIDREPSTPNPGADPTAFIMRVDPNWRGAAGNSTPTADDFKSAEGVLYSKVVSGSRIGSGDHTALFIASDGKNQVDLRLAGPSIQAASITELGVTPSPVEIGQQVRVVGKLLPLMASERDRYVYLKVTKPDGSRLDLGTSAKVPVDADTGEFISDPFTPDMNSPDATRLWRVEASWPGNAQFEKTSRTVTFEVTMAPYQIKERPDGTPVIDMICCPLLPTSGHPDALFGIENARQMRIQRWDPVENIYFRFGETYFPPLSGGDAMWIYPTVAYPPGQSPRFIKPFGRLHPQDQIFHLTIRRGWNQIGTAFLTSIPLENLKVRRQGRDMSLSEAAAAGICRDYLWGWDALKDPTGKNNYFLVANRPGAQNVLRPWAGYWIRAFVDTELVMYPPRVGTSAAAPPATEDVGPAATRGWEDLDQPPPAP